MLKLHRLADSIKNAINEQKEDEREKIRQKRKTRIEVVQRRKARRAKTLSKMKRTLAGEKIIDGINICVMIINQLKMINRQMMKKLIKKEEKVC